MASFRHPRVVEIYDAQFSWSREDDFFFTFVNQTPSARVADLACGTGRLTLALAAAGHQATSVDPARASLDAAQAKPDAVDQIYGGWEAEPVGSTDGELLVLAHRPAATGH